MDAKHVVAIILFALAAILFAVSATDAAAPQQPRLVSLGLTATAAGLALLAWNG